MKLLVVSDYAWPTGGTEQFVKEMLARADREFEVRLLTWDEPLPLPAGFTGLIGVRRGDVSQVYSAFEWADCLLVVTSFNVRLLAGMASQYLEADPKPAVSVVQTSAHSAPEAPSRRRQEKWLGDLVRLSDSTVAVSDAVAESLARLIGDATPRGSIVVVENGARLGPLAPRSPRGRSRVSFVGRPVHHKGLHLFERLAADTRGLGLELAANTVSLPPRSTAAGIRYSHLLTDAQLVEFFDDTDLLVAPYMGADGLPLALLEALNCGVPILGFDRPPVGDLLRRYRQATVPPSYDALLAAVRSWAAGELTIEPPVAGTVPGWDRQWTHYERLLRSAVAATSSSHNEVGDADRGRRRGHRS